MADAPRPATPLDLGLIKIRLDNGEYRRREDWGGLDPYWHVEACIEALLGEIDRQAEEIRRLRALVDAKAKELDRLRGLASDYRVQAAPAEMAALYPAKPHE